MYGAQAGDLTSSGSDNSFFGYDAGYYNTTGLSNSFFGSGSGFYCTASYNSFFGFNCGRNSTTGGGNTFMGESAGMGNLTGDNNTYIGASAGRASTGQGNTFVGSQSGRTNSGGYNNTALGNSSFYSNLIGNGCTIIGNFAGYYSNANYNTFVGEQAGYNDQGGYSNTFMGEQAGYNTIGGNSNASFGYQAGFNNSSGSGNSYLGDYAGPQNQTGSNNTFVGYLSGYNNGSTINVTNSTAIGWKSYVAQNNSVVIGSVYNAGLSVPQARVGIGNASPSSLLDVVSGDASIGTAISGITISPSGNGGVLECSVGTSAYGIWGKSTTGYAGYFTGNVGYTGTLTNVSDAKLKENVQPLTDALSKIEMLNAKTYTFKPEYAKMNLPKGTQMGFIAQDLEKVFPELVLTGYDKSMDEKNPMEYKSVNYIGMIPVLAEAVKELDALQTENTQTANDAIAQLQTENADLKNELAAMKLQMQQFETSLSQCCLANQNNSGTQTGNSINQFPSLEQNTPNPFSQNTLIRYYLLSNTSSAQITISDLNGRVLKTFSLAGTGVGQVSINGGELSSGDYLYTLTIGGNKIDTKKMTLTK